MGRAKLRMELITKEKTRNTTYQKRKYGIIKKANEFTILCDVDTMIIIYPPNSNDPEIWPENPEKIKNAIASYKAKKSESGKRTYDLTDFFEDRKKKIEDELVKARKRNVEAKYSTWFDELDGLSESQLRQFAIGLENKENIVRAKLEFKKRNINMQLPFKFELENNRPIFHYAASHPSLDQAQLVNQRFMNHDFGWLNNAPTNSFIPLKQEMVGYGYPEGGMVYDNSKLKQAMVGYGYPEGGMVYDNSKLKQEMVGYGYPEGGMAYDNSNPWVFQPPVVQGLMPELPLALQDPQVNHHEYGGVTNFAMDDHRLRFMG